MEFPSNNLQAEVDVSTFSEKFMGWKIRVWIRGKGIFATWLSYVYFDKFEERIIERFSTRKRRSSLSPSWSGLVLCSEWRSTHCWDF